MSESTGLPASGRLVITRGVNDLVLRAHPTLTELYTARFEGVQPEVTEQNGTVAVTYNWHLFSGVWEKTSAEITLNATIPWQIEIRNGVSQMNADLRSLALQGLEIGGGASKVDAQLPSPSGTVPIHIGGGASKVALRRPKAVPVHVSIGGGLSHFEMDEFRLGSVGGPLDWESPSYKDAPDRYDVAIGGGASRLTIAS